MRFTKPALSIALSAFVCMMIAGCAAFRSDITGKIDDAADKNFGAKPVSVLFIFSHSSQIKGLDAIPKLQTKRQIMRGFDDIFFDALPEISNVGSYATYTEYSSDVNDPARRALKDSLSASQDYVIEMRFKQETSFVRNFLGTLVSISSATLFPIPYSRSHSLETKVFANDRALIAQFSHHTRVTIWVETVLVFIYPFHTEKRKTEELYVDMLHDVFRQIDGQKVLAGR